MLQTSTCPSSQGHTEPFKQNQASWQNVKIQQADTVCENYLLLKRLRWSNHKYKQTTSEIKCYSCLGPGPGPGPEAAGPRPSHYHHVLFMKWSLYRFGAFFFTKESLHLKTACCYLWLKLVWRSQEHEIKQTLIFHSSCFQGHFEALNMKDILLQLLFNYDSEVNYFLSTLVTRQLGCTF